MKSTHPQGLLLLSVAGALVLAAATGLAFAGWMAHAPGIFMAMVESGLAWCF